jgi:hypothetical protein
MSRRLVGIILLLVGSEILGLLAGQQFFRLMDSWVPPAVITDLSRSSARALYLMGGLGLGFVVFLWSLLAAWLARLFVGGARKAVTPSGSVR